VTAPHQSDEAVEIGAFQQREEAADRQAATATMIVRHYCFCLATPALLAFATA
jgi:hypothetical protein